MPSTFHRKNIVIVDQRRVIDYSNYLHLTSHIRIGIRRRFRCLCLHLAQATAGHNRVYFGSFRQDSSSAKPLTLLVALRGSTGSPSSHISTDLDYRSFVFASVSPRAGNNIHSVSPAMMESKYSPISWPRAKVRSGGMTSFTVLSRAASSLAGTSSTSDWAHVLPPCLVLWDALGSSSTHSVPTNLPNLRTSSHFIPCALSTK